VFSLKYFVCDVQAVLQLIPVGELVTVPSPAVFVSSMDGFRANVALCVLLPFIVTTHVFAVGVLVHAPAFVQPVNT
jgi:hypothetical protein